MNMLIQALLLGISYGFGPCMISCAPVLVPLLISTSKNTRQAFVATLIFSLGRITVYVILGLMMGAIGRLLNVTLPRWFVGAFMIALGLSVMFRVQNRCLLSKIKITGPHMAFVAGLLMGITPCAPMLAALALAVSAKSVIMGGLIALVFGIGTVVSPLLIIGILSGKWAQLKEFRSINHFVAGGFLILLGILSMLQ
jgi:uncharacterized protein